MTLRASIPRALIHAAAGILLIALIGAGTIRWQQGRWPATDFYVSFLIALVLVPVAVCIIVVPRSITLTVDTLRIEWPFRRTVAVPTDELEHYMQGRLFMIQLEQHPTQLIYDGAFPRRDWRAFTRELESRFPDRKASFYAGTLLYGRRKP